MAEINQQPAPNGPATTPSTPTPASTPPPAAAAPATSTSASTVTAQADEGRLRGISRSVIIGVGGTGHQIILAVRKRLIEKYGSLDKLPIVGFALLDTDQAIFSKNPDYDDAVNLDSADKIHCSVHGVDNLRKNLRDHPHLRNWLDPRVLTGDIDQGAGAVRARGRLAYFWNYATIARKLETVSQRLADELSVEQTAKRFIVSTDPDEHVERIKTYLDLGFNHLVFHAPGPGQATFLRLYGEEILPRLRAL